MKKILSSIVLLSATLLNANIANLNSLESDFKQSIINDQNSKIVYSGKMYATKKDNKALWIYKTPVEKKIYYNVGQIVIIEPELEQAIFAKLSKVPNIMQLLSDAKKVSSDKLITTFNKIKYTIIIDDKKIQTISYVDEMQNKVSIEFNSQFINKTIPKDMFSYNIPESFDILEQ